MCGGPEWKRENVPDHKFDFVDTRDFTDNGFWMRIRYLWIYVLVLKSFLVYISDIFTAITMITTKNWSNQIFNSCTDSKEGCVVIPFAVGKWIFVGCIIFSFLLLAYESRKARKIIASRDISYAFTNVMANNYYSLRSYDHFCFFQRIQSSTKKIDDFAFFIFFTFKSWKRVLLADGPRQVINALTLYSFYISHKGTGGKWYNLNKYTGGNLVTTALLCSTAFTVIVFAGSALLLFAAGVLYIPLLCHIRGNLKEYCCHKVDKRISEIIRRRNKERTAKATALQRKEAAGDFSHLKNKKGEFIHNPLPQPTLPNITLDDDDDDVSSFRTRGPPPSTYSGKADFYNADYKGAYPDYPPAPAYNNPYAYGQGNGQYTQSALTMVNDQQNGFYDDENASKVHLTTAAAPLARRPSDPYGNPTASGYTSNNDYGNAPSYTPYGTTNGSTGQYYEGFNPDEKLPTPDYSQQRHEVPQTQSQEAQRAERPTSGLAYDDDPADDYTATASAPQYSQPPSQYYPSSRQSDHDHGHSGGDYGGSYGIAR